MNAIFIRRGNRLGNCHATLNPRTQKAVAHSENFRPFGDSFSLSTVLNKVIIFFVSALGLAGRPTNVSGGVSSVVVDPINAELPDRFRALPNRGSNVIPEGTEVGPFGTHGYPSEEVAMGLLKVGLASPVHINPSRVKNSSFLWILVLPMLREPSSSAFNLPATAAFHGLKLMAKVVLGLPAIAQAFPYRVSLVVEACKITHKQAMETLSKVTFYVGRYVHLSTICGMPHFVNK